MRPLYKFILAIGLLFAIIAWFLTAPKQVADTMFDGLSPDSANGELVFYATGCSSCHSAIGATEEAKLILTGGHAFETAFGTFYAPNISPSDAGIAGWSAIDLANALRHGTSPNGKHYFPALPYTSYQNMRAQDILDLHAYLVTLPADPTPSLAHDVGFPFNIRRSLGGWKLLFMPSTQHVEIASDDPVLQRGQYLVEGMGHCGECHTPRHALGGWASNAWLKGGPNPDGKGMIPSLHPRDLAWSQDEIIEYLSTGFTPDFDVVGGAMASVQENIAKLPESDIAAIARYLVSLP